MRVFNSEKYSYAGKVDGFYIFESRHKDPRDREFVLVERAKMINPNGSYRYYDVNHEVADSWAHVVGQVEKFKAYSDAITLIRSKDKLKPDYCASSIDDSIERVCLTQAPKPTHIPKRKDAGGNSPVSTIKVNRRKLVSADA